LAKHLRLGIEDGLECGSHHDEDSTTGAPQYMTGQSEFATRWRGLSRCGRPAFSLSSWRWTLTATALRAFRDQADKADWALIYFAGRLRSTVSTVSFRSIRSSSMIAMYRIVSYEELLRAAGGAKMLRLLVLDACRIDPFKDSSRRVAARGSDDRGLAPPPEPEAGIMVVYSAKDGEVAADDIDGVNSPFARAR
jgi:hypothetical protein